MVYEELSIHGKILDAIHNATFTIEDEIQKDEHMTTFTGHNIFDYKQPTKLFIANHSFIYCVEHKDSGIQFLIGSYE